MKTISFYSRSDDWFELSNIYPQGFEEDGSYWPSVEHYFQAMKFDGDHCSAYRERIRKAASTREAKDLGRTKKPAIRSDWDSVRDDVMIHALRQKFKHPKLAKVLLATGDSILVEKSSSDYYWGIGASGTGINRLGELLLQVRAELVASRMP